MKETELDIRLHFTDEKGMDETIKRIEAHRRNEYVSFGKNGWNVPHYLENLRLECGHCDFRSNDFYYDQTDSAGEIYLEGIIQDGFEVTEQDAKILIAYFRKSPGCDRVEITCCLWQENFLTEYVFEDGTLKRFTLDLPSTNTNAIIEAHGDLSYVWNPENLKEYSKISWKPQNERAK